MALKRDPWLDRQIVTCGTCAGRCYMRDVDAHMAKHLALIDEVGWDKALAIWKEVHHRRTGFRTRLAVANSNRMPPLLAEIDYDFALGA